MKLTIEQVEARMTAAWGRPAFVVPYRLAGNLYSWVVTDHREHWMPLFSSWAGGHQMLAPVSGRWPDIAPTPALWMEAVAEAVELARAYFVSQGDSAALKRLPRAQAIAETQNWTLLGDELDTWLIPSCSKGGVVYQVNGRCTCPDFTDNGVRWCKHRQARALAKRATEILKNKNGAGGGSNTPAPALVKGPTKGEADSTTAPTNGQAQRIDLIVAYELDEAQVVPCISGSGQLISFKADGQVTTPPVQTMPKLYRWLQEHGYAPDSFKWLGWEHGLRQRRQTYVQQEVAR
jgi:hypothetical protein